MDNYSWDQPVSKSSESSELLNGKINISLTYQILPFFFFFVFFKAMKLARKTKKPQQKKTNKAKSTRKVQQNTVITET